MTDLRIKEVAKLKGLTLQDLAKQIGIDYTSLYRRLNNSKFDTLKKIAEILNCEVIELINVGDDYLHVYDLNTGIWLGIIKKERK